MKSDKKPRVEDDPRWEEYNRLNKVGFWLKANKLKETILDSYKWKKPCHHVGGEIRK